MSSLKDSFLVGPRAQPRATPQSKELCPQSVVPGPTGTSIDSKNANPGPDKGNPIGVGSLGNSSKPFGALGGG